MPGSGWHHCQQLGQTRWVGWGPRSSSTLWGVSRSIYNPITLLSSQIPLQHWPQFQPTVRHSSWPTIFPIICSTSTLRRSEPSRSSKKWETFSDWIWFISQYVSSWQAAAAAGVNSALWQRLWWWNQDDLIYYYTSVCRGVTGNTTVWIFWHWRPRGPGPFFSSGGGGLK